MSLELYRQYGVPTLFLVFGLIVYAVARFQSRRAGGTKAGPT
jgi:hypothetical protein